MHESVRMILGNYENISTLCAYVNNKDNTKEQIKKIVENINPEDELLVITDIFGGSVNNEFMKYINKENLYLISGLCLPLIIELVTSEEKDIGKLIEATITSTKESIKYCNKTFNKANSIEDDEF